MSFFFSRDTKVFMKWSADGTTANTAVYEIPVLDGFSFNFSKNLWYRIQFIAKVTFEITLM